MPTGSPIRASEKAPLGQLLPLAGGLAAVLAFILLLAWAAYHAQVTLAGFLNAESLWSKAQKQAVIDLDRYSATGQPVYLRDFRANYELLQSDAKARDNIISRHFSYRKVSAAFARGDVMPSAKQGMIYALEYLGWAPDIGPALKSWQATDKPIRKLDAIARRLSAAYAHAKPSPAFLAREDAKIYAINSTIKPLSDRFSRMIAQGAGRIGRVIFLGVSAASLAALILWLLMARRFLRRIRVTEERYRLLFDYATDAIVMVDAADGRILDANDRAARWSGRDRQALIGTAFGALFAGDRAPWESTAPLSLMRGPKGHVRSVETQTSMVTWGKRRVRQAILRDVSERVAMDQERRIAAEALASIAEGVVIADAERRVLSVNRAHEQITGYTENELQGRPFDQTRTLMDGSPLPASVWEAIAESGHWGGEVLSRRRDGTTYPELLSMTAIRAPDGAVQQYVAVFTNITEAKASHERLEYLASHDGLTGLVNRSEFERHCDSAIREASGRRRAVAVLFVDLDNFKVVNDSFSHAVGDRLLTKVAARIERQLPKGVLACRIGGDEFTVLLADLAVREDAATVAERLTKALSEPFAVQDYDIVISASIGIAGYPLDGSDTVQLIANADAAMHTAKTQERNSFRYYSPRMHADVKRRTLLAADLRLALLEESFRLVYQPSVDMRSGRLIGVEALIRWRHPTRGEVSPGDFIPLAERMGLIRRIDEWVMREVCRQIAAWDAQGVPPFRVAVNVSASWFGHPGFVETVKETLQPHRFENERILLEITESAILGKGQDIAGTMQALNALGIRLAIDDFGTGYSSLAYLKLPAVSYLKIDGSFIDHLPESENDVAIVKAMLAIARSLGLCPIAEGVESEAQHAFLLRAGCPEAQGYLYSHPISPEEIAAMQVHNSAARLLHLVPPT